MSSPSLLPQCYIDVQRALQISMAPAVNVWDQIKNNISILSFDKYFETINTILTPENIYTLYAYFSLLVALHLVF